jgi:hypothetical protein
MDDEFLDLSSEQARFHLRILGIDPDNYHTVPDEPGERRLVTARQTLSRLLGRPARRDDS